ncbi:MAG TPA: NAD(P)-dependent oxidoreductase [Noviherbaspirillum sp.]|nr:NAD(P)-dependent oxidoreductase [Noviherbaspirillum sp.]
MHASANKMMAVGFLGLGLMGHGLARNVQRAGHPVSLLVRSDEARKRVADLLDAGATSASTAHEVAASANVIVICVTGAPDVEELVLGEKGLLESVGAGMTVIDCSTSLPETSRRIATAVHARGGHFIDAALTGTPREAEEGTVNLLVGGDPEVIGRVTPLLHSFARNIYHCGAVGTGHTVKLLHQFIVLGNAAILAEAFGIAKSAGVDLQVLCDVIASGGANSTAFQRFRPYVLEGDDSLFRFSLSNANKDMRYFLRMVSESGLRSSLGKQVGVAYEAAKDAGYGDKFVPHLIDVD